MRRTWEYAVRGEYHRNLDLNWSYAPTYLQKMMLVDRVVAELPMDGRILDAGCGEGTLVDKYRAQGREIYGLDLNYNSSIVLSGTLTQIPFCDNAFDLVLLLDVFEHIAFAEQPIVLNELKRILRPGGRLMASIPNLAHWNSRVRLLFFGELDRTDIETNHVGERPYAENRRCLKDAGFEVQSCSGITLTVPFIYRRVICRNPKRMRWLHDALEPFARCLPELSFLGCFICRKPFLSE
jgi:2-polyprenyl-3-methyl-5-hydroxy-6-metoxy-1,4-benzoquinol methylase